jgi:Sulfotransferase domain
LHAFTPNARFVIILRNPVDRAYSLYQHMTRAGDEWIGSFEEALAAEESRAASSDFEWNNPQYYYNYLYFRCGLYAEQIERYYDWFPRDRFLFLTFDQLKADGFNVLRKTCEFLGVDPSRFAPGLCAYNKGEYAVRSPRWHYFLKHGLGPFLSSLRFPGGEAVIRWLMTRNRVESVIPPMSPLTREFLRIRYAENLRRVEQLTGLDLTAWLTPWDQRAKESTLVGGDPLSFSSKAGLVGKSTKSSQAA